MVSRIKASPFSQRCAARQGKTEAQPPNEKQPNNNNTMQTELSNTHEAEEMMAQNRGMSNSSLHAPSSDSFQECSSSSGVREIRVAIEIGHSAKDPGALFRPPFNDLYEGEYDYWSTNAQTIVDLIREKFERTKHMLPIPTELCVKLFNRGDYDFSLGNMVSAVSAWAPHVAVGLHLNSADNENAFGHLCVKVRTDAEAVALSARINSRMTDIPHHQREDTDGSTKAWCRQISGGVIVEAGFVSSPSDASFLCYMHEAITEAIASGIYDYMVDKEYAI